VNLRMGLRAAAVVLGIAGVIDPVWRVEREMPRPVDLLLSQERSDAAIAPAEVAQRIVQTMRTDVTFESSAAPVARVVVGRQPVDGAGIPTSFVRLDGSSVSAVQIENVAEPRAAIAGWRTTISATVRGRGVAGTTSSLVLEQNGVELGRVEHKWSGADERAEVSIPYVPPVDGAALLSLRVAPKSGEVTAADTADFRLIARARRLRVLVHEPRPSWAASFVRRTLEANAAFEVSAFAGASKGLAVRAGTAPPRLDSQIDEFDAIIVGAPEELAASEVDALGRFARRRGGAVLLVPDRRPSGPYLALLRSREFDEVLVEKPMSATGADGGIIRASELALPRSTAEIADVLASTARDGKDRPVVYAWPLGAGRVVFSGALDAWRFRAAGEDDFNRFWTSTVAAAALASPERLEVTVAPGLARTRDKVAIRVRVRGSDVAESPEGVRVPPVEARVISAQGAQEVVRLWPVEEPGTFEGWLEAPAAGRYDVQAASGAVKADTILIVDDGANVRRPAGPADREEAIAAATGGVVVAADDLEPLVRALRAIPAPRRAHDVHPTRSPWFVAAFAVLLSGEWMLRRRSGLR
jgi:hypothetical protein